MEREATHSQFSLVQCLQYLISIWKVFGYLPERTLAVWKDGATAFKYSQYGGIYTHIGVFHYWWMGGGLKIREPAVTSSPPLEYVESCFIRRGRCGVQLSDFPPSDANPMP